jgi:hypothetical protein
MRGTPEDQFGNLALSAHVMQTIGERFDPLQSLQAFRLREFGSNEALETLESDVADVLNADADLGRVPVRSIAAVPRTAETAYPARTRRRFMPTRFMCVADDVHRAPCRATS